MQKIEKAKENKTNYDVYIRNIKIVAEYKGNMYYGFQMQKDKKTVQGELTKLLEELFNEKIYIIASGRTDRGVHALNQVMNFKINSDIENFKIKKFLNRKLNKTDNKYLKIKEVEDVPMDFNANLSARSKTYMYILNYSYESGIYNDLEYTYLKELDKEKMEKAVAKFIGTKDFASFCNRDNETKTTIRTIYDFTMEDIDGKLIFNISADGFLNKMVRIIIGTILDIGLSKMDLNDLDKIFDAKDRKQAGRTIPAKGLYLVKVNY